LDDLLGACDVVDVCAPTHLHREVVEATAAAGRPVICEKPLARTVEDGEAMIAACRAAGVPLFVAHVVRYINEYVAAKEAVEAGRVGRLAVVRLRRESSRPNKPADHWFFDPGKSGGMMMDLLVHDYDYARYLAGDEGLIQYDSTDAVPVTSYLVGKRDEGEASTGLPNSPVAENPWALELADFVTSIQGGGPPRVTAEDGLEAVRIASSVIESARTGRPVMLHPEAGEGSR
jgi:predicted dehydrogenase